MLSKICGIIAFLGMAVLTLIATQYFIRIANFGNGNFSSYILASFKMMVKSLVRWICHVRSYTHWTKWMLMVKLMHISSKACGKNIDIRYCIGNSQ